MIDLILFIAYMIPVCIIADFIMYPSGRGTYVKVLQDMEYEELKKGDVLRVERIIRKEVGAGCYIAVIHPKYHLWKIALTPFEVINITAYEYWIRKLLK